MSEKKYYMILLLITVLGLASLTALLIFSYVLYKDCSIISYVANRG